MSGKTAPPDGLQQVQAFRYSTVDSNQAFVEEQCKIAQEGPVTIDVEDVGAYTVLCTPADKRAMAVGFLYSEGIIDGVEDILLLNECVDDPNVIRIRLQKQPSSINHDRNLLITSSCGLCGSQSMDEKLAAMPKVGSTLNVSSTILRQVAIRVRPKQRMFQACGGTHAAQLFSADGELVSFAEDIGRHNALDKAIGNCLLLRKPTAGHGVMLSGRVSLEMVGKCARAGIELISAVSAPTSLAVRAATHCNITLCAFVRDDRATVFTGQERVAVGLDDG